ncbi:hypothetical protein LZ32DRAFT_39052 [Colletotrichum eremochloae]|nr:hypothetical protein LZ32DRAFT_39052 [Colletotrichum eremochloae]
MTFFLFFSFPIFPLQRVYFRVNTPRAWIVFFGYLARPESQFLRRGTVACHEIPHFRSDLGRTLTAYLSRRFMLAEFKLAHLSSCSWLFVCLLAK